MTLSWDALESADSYYVVYYLPSTGWQGETVTDTFLTLSHNGNGYAYFYVRSECGVGQVSSYSSLQFIELPSCPSISIEASVATFCFGESSTLTASSGFDSYQWYNDDGAIDGAVSSTYTATAGGHYYAIGHTSSGCSISSNEVSLSMITLSAVSVLEVDNITSSSASLNWDGVSPTNVYNISYSSDGGDTWVDITSHTGSYINLSGLQPSTTYDVEITSTAYDCESAVFSGSFTTIFDCVTPENINVSYNFSEATISWDEIIGASSYEVLYNFGAGFTSANTESNSITLSLSGAITNTFYVRVNCPDGQQSAWSTAQSFTLSCDAPSNVSASNVGTDVTIDWDGSASSYTLLYNSGGAWMVVNSIDSEYSISNVSIGTNVIFYIKSVCHEESNFVSGWTAGSYVTTSAGRLVNNVHFDFDVYPNPTEGIVNVSLDSEVEQNITIRLVDPFGKEVFAKQFKVGFESSKLEFDISNYAKGVYFLQFVSDDIIKTKRILLH